MATAILYTTMEAIRATLGIDEYDVTDQMILDYGLAPIMEARLSQVMPNYDCAFDNDAVAPLLTLWCQWYGALSFIETAQLAIAKKYQANQDTLERFPVDFAALAEALKAKLGQVESMLNPDLALELSTGHTLVGLSKPSYDPVMGGVGRSQVTEFDRGLGGRRPI